LNGAEVEIEFAAQAKGGLGFNGMGGRDAALVSAILPQPASERRICRSQSLA